MRLHTHPHGSKCSLVEGTSRGAAGCNGTEGNPQSWLWGWVVHSLVGDTPRGGQPEQEGKLELSHKLEWCQKTPPHLLQHAVCQLRDVRCRRGLQCESHLGGTSWKTNWHFYSLTYFQPRVWNYTFLASLHIFANDTSLCVDNVSVSRKILKSKTGQVKGLR